MQWMNAYDENTKLLREDACRKVRKWNNNYVRLLCNKLKHGVEPDVLRYEMYTTYIMYTHEFRKMYGISIGICIERCLDKFFFRDTQK